MGRSDGKEQADLEESVHGIKKKWRMKGFFFLSGLGNSLILLLRASKECQIHPLEQEVQIFPCTIQFDQLLSPFIPSSATVIVLTLKKIVLNYFAASSFKRLLARGLFLGVRAE